MKASRGCEVAPTVEELRARLCTLPGRLRALGRALARGEIDPELADVQGRLLDAEGDAIARALATYPARPRLADELLRALEAHA
ncbi:hypothetical protein [Sorangium sp. So ce124]|uniref:hypothetical protein n=1 Tax=Sorangium sp. So ce124 TaxID=3133280 RepID=UPI003F605618